MLVILFKTRFIRNYFIKLTPLLMCFIVFIISIFLPSSILTPSASIETRAGLFFLPHFVFEATALVIIKYKIPI